MRDVWTTPKLFVWEMGVYTIFVWKLDEMFCKHIGSPGENVDISTLLCHDLMTALPGHLIDDSRPPQEFMTGKIVKEKLLNFQFQNVKTDQVGVPYFCLEQRKNHWSTNFIIKLIAKQMSKGSLFNREAKSDIQYSLAGWRILSWEFLILNLIPSSKSYSITKLTVLGLSPRLLLGA